MGEKDKLEKLFLMLSSPNDGEVVAAARAIDRHLKTIKQDWHWLSSKLSGPAPVKQHTQKPRYHKPREPVFDDEEWEQKLEKCFEYLEDIPNQKSQDFVESMHEKYKKWGSRMFISEKQINWLNGIYDQLSSKGFF